MESWKARLQTVKTELPKRTEAEVEKRLGSVWFTTRTDEGAYGVNKEVMGVLQDAPGISTHHDHDVRTEYPRTELLLIALLSENPTSFEAFLQHQVAAEKEQRRMVRVSHKKLSKRLQVQDIKEIPLLAHDFGLGLPADVEPPLKDKKILFVGGGSSGRLLLPRFKSDGATAVNIDPYAQGMDVVNSWIGYHTREGMSGAGEIEERQEVFAPENANRLAEDYGAFDAVVIQNLFDYGSVDTEQGILEILHGLREVSKKGTVLVLQVDSLPDTHRKLIAHELFVLGFRKRAELDTYEGQRGKGYVFEKE